MIEYFISNGVEEKHIQIQDKGIIKINDSESQYELVQKTEEEFLLFYKNRIYEIKKISQRRTEDKNIFGFLLNINYFELSIKIKLEKLLTNYLNQDQHKKHAVQIVSPMPGLVFKVIRNIGEFIEEGDSLIILEAMKMENEIKAPVSGMIKEIFVSEKQAIEKGAILLEID